MNRQTVLENLCVYNKRSPYFDSEHKIPPKSVCYCDNCFYNRDKLAREILKLQEEIQSC